MYNLDNEIINGIHITRYIASYLRRKEGFKILEFVEWLKTLEINGRHLTDDEVYRIRIIAEDGKLELQELAISFVPTVRKKK